MQKRCNTHKGIFYAIYEEVKKIPPGKTRSYKEIAQAVGTIPKVVGYALHCNPDPEKIPCHRVVYADGSFSSGYAFGGKEKQKEKVLKEKLF